MQNMRNQKDEALEIALGEIGLRYWEYDIKTKRLYRSKLVQNEVGYSAYKENVPESYVEEGIIHPDYAQAYIDFYYNLGKGIGERLVFRSKFGDNSWGWLDISYKVLFDENGKPYKAIGVGGDVTRQKENERRLIEREAQLEAALAAEKLANSAKSDFLARMSHDIRTPLNVIIGMSRLAQDNANPDDTNSCLKKIDIASEFLLGLINDILDMEKINTGKTKLNYEPYSGDEFSQYIEAVIRPLCAQKNISFEYTYDGPHDFTIMQDKLRTNQIYFNLLSNAVKFTPEGGRIIFNTKCWRKNKHMVLDVIIADNGIGMSREFQEHMFEPFSQENQATPLSIGTGLGLTIVKSMCDLMNMTIAAESELGKGTTFSLHGEYEIAKKQAKENIMLTHNLEPTDDMILQDKTILVCEDHPLNQEIIRRLLEKKGMNVVLADDGRSGLDIFCKSIPYNFAAILMDIRMPVMDGLQAAEAIRKLDRIDAKAVPIIALTANAYSDDVMKCRAAGMNEHLAKPIRADDIYSTLVRFIRNSKQYGNDK